jgi:hypothetical protein
MARPSAKSKTGSPASRLAMHRMIRTICERCERATQDAGGRIIDVAPTVGDRARCDAEHVGHVDAEVPTRTTTSIPLSIRRVVMRRDHHRCRVPGCGASKWLEVHHIIPREAGGTHDPSNLVVLCGAHHRAHHEGHLQIRGTAERLRVERRDGSRYEAFREMTTGQHPCDNAAAIVR